MDEHARPPGVAQELGAEARPLAGALDQSWEIGDDHVRVAGHHDAQDGLQGGEWVRRDPWPGVADTGQQRGFARIGRAYETHVGDQLELEAQPALGSIGAAKRQVGRRKPRGLEARVAAAPGTAAGDDLDLVGIDEIVQHMRRRIGIHHGAERDIDGHGLAIPPVPAAGLPGRAVAGDETMAVLQVGEGVQIPACPDQDVAAAAAVTAVRSAKRHVLLASEARRAVAAAPGSDVDAGLVEEIDGGIGHGISAAAAQRNSAPRRAPRRSTCRAKL